jgi:DNA-binding response OmpR family regulator
MPADKSILLIEDDREISSTIQGVLQAAGYRVAAAQNGVEGRRIIDSDPPALIITDMMMPKMGGFPILEYLRGLSSPPRVIMITANEGGRHKAYAEMLGVDEYLRKPFAMDVLLEAVERIIGSAESGSSGAGASRLKRPPSKRAPQ